MPHFAYCVNNIVQNVQRIESYVMIDDEGKESEELGQKFLANLYPETNPSDYIMTFYPIGQPDPYPRGKYAGIGNVWDGTKFIDQIIE